MKNTQVLRLKVNRLVNNLFIWNYKTAFKWKWIQFSDYRSYDENDDAKYIDFLASSKEWNTLVKQFAEERELHVFFLLDISKTMQFGEPASKIETLKKIFYILSFSAYKNNDRIGAILFNDVWYEMVPLWKWLKNIHHILNVIETNNISKRDNFGVNQVISYFNNMPVKNNLVFVLTDKMDEIDEKYLKVLSYKNDVVYINIFDFIENNLLNQDGIFKLKSEQHTFFLNLRNKTKVERYQKLRQAKIHDLSLRLKKIGIDYMFIDNTMDIFTRMLLFFKSR